jgi:glycosyltransferase involved in cell wall biosynthesis
MRRDVLFVHNNFPGQFAKLAAHLAQVPDLRVQAIGSLTSGSIPDVAVERYRAVPGRSPEIHAFARRFDDECRRAEQVMYVANALKAGGFNPSLICVHPGWGEALPLRSIFPGAKICVYAEFYYRTQGTDVGFEEEHGSFGVDGATRIAARNASNLLAMADADFAYAPTRWQRGLFPNEFQDKIRVIHDGVDTGALQPFDGVGQEEEVVTYVARNLEPYRGFHHFMRTLPQVLRARPNAQVFIVGGDGVSYGNKPDDFGNWREAMLAELGGALDLTRVHFTGAIAYDAYIRLLRRSSVHVYLTYPFVLSWSVLEAMALACHIIGSDTAPVREFIEDGHNGQLVPFDDPRVLAERMIEALADRKRFAGYRSAARQTVIDRCDLETIVIPAQRTLLEEQVPGLLGRSKAPARKRLPLEPLLLELLRES